MSKNLAAGTNSNFTHTITTSASQDEIWRLWTDSRTWGSWDGGLKSANTLGRFEKGTQGTITDLSGRDSKFIVTEYTPKKSYAFETNLPLAKLTVRRYFENSNQGQTTFIHHVKFSGPLGWLFASQFGPDFRAELPPTMERLAKIAEGS